MLFVSHLQNGFTSLIQGKYTNTHTLLPQALSNKLLLKVHQIQKITKIYLKIKFRKAYFRIRQQHCCNLLLKDYHYMTPSEQFGFKEVLVIQHKVVTTNHLKPDNSSSNKDTLLRMALQFAVERKIHDNIGSLSRCLPYSYTHSNITL